MDGSGQAQESRWHPPTQPLQAGAINHGLSPVTKPNLSPIMCHNPTMPSLTSMEAWRHAWEFSMTFMMTASNGTILLATIPNHSSVRTLTSFLNMFRLWSRNSNLDQKLLEAQVQTINLIFIVTVAYLMP